MPDACSAHGLTSPKTCFGFDFVCFIQVQTLFSKVCSPIRQTKNPLTLPRSVRLDRKPSETEFVFQHTVEKRQGMFRQREKLHRTNLIATSKRNFELEIEVNYE